MTSPARANDRVDHIVRVEVPALRHVSAVRESTQVSVAEPAILADIADIAVSFAFAAAEPKIAAALDIGRNAVGYDLLSLGVRGNRARKNCDSQH